MPLISKLGKKRLLVLAAAVLVAAGSTIAAGLELFWLATAGLGVLQVAVLALLLRQSPSVAKPAASVNRPDALDARIMAAMETERLDAVDRHRELLSAVRGSITPASGR